MYGLIEGGPGAQRWQMIVGYLTKALFLEEDITTLPIDTQQRHYINVSPLLPIALRAWPDWVTNKAGFADKMKHAFILFYAYKIKD